MKKHTYKAISEKLNGLAMFSRAELYDIITLMGRASIGCTIKCALEVCPDLSAKDIDEIIAALM